MRLWTQSEYMYNNYSELGQQCEFSLVPAVSGGSWGGIYWCNYSKFLCGLPVSQLAAHVTRNKHLHLKSLMMSWKGRLAIEEDYRMGIVVTWTVANSILWKPLIIMCRLGRLLQASLDYLKSLLMVYLCTQNRYVVGNSSNQNIICALHSAEWQWLCWY